MCWDSDYIVWLNNPRGWSNEYTLLSYDAVSWVLRFFLNSILVLRFLSQEQNPAGFIKEAIAGEEEGYMAISRKVYEFGVPSIVLEFSLDFNLLLFGSIVFCRLQYWIFDSLYIKVLCLHFSLTYTPKA